MIRYGCQSIDAADKAAVMAVLESDWLTQGPAIPRFEQAVASYCNVPFATAVSSGTAALHISCLALGVGPGDYVWTSPNTFVASANCALYCGAKVDFVDIDRATLNLDPAKLADKLAAAQREGRLPKAVIPVHFSGRSCDMEAIAILGREFGFRIIEDASHALGATYRGTKVGSCTYSDIAVTSFHPVKLITTGEGGMVLTKDEAIAERLARLRSHGTTSDPSLAQGDWDGPWYYQQIDLGYNYRMTDLQAALGTSQMAKLPAFVARRRELVHRYRTLLADMPVALPDDGADDESAWHLFVVRVAADRRRQIFEALRAMEIIVNVHYIPVHLQPWYRRQFGFAPGDFPEAERYYREAMTLPLHPALTEADQDTVVAALASLLP